MLPRPHVLHTGNIGSLRTLSNVLAYHRIGRTQSALYGYSRLGNLIISDYRAINLQIRLQFSKQCALHLCRGTDCSPVPCKISTQPFRFSFKV